jgi:hypothetical protein
VCLNQPTELFYNKSISINYIMSLNSIPGFGSSEEAEAAEKILGYFDEGDADGMKSCTSQPLFTYLDNEVMSHPLFCLSTTTLHIKGCIIAV